MSHEFVQGFSVREKMWHGLGTVLDDYPGREDGMRIAGHDFDVIERDIAVITPYAGDGELGDQWAALDDGLVSLDRAMAFKALIKGSHRGAEDPDHGSVLHVANADYGVINNSVGWDIVDAMVGEGIKYETGLTLKGGAICSVLAWLDEPVRLPGDDSDILPWVNVSWAHDGSASLSARPTSIRTVCWNTQSAAEALGKRLGLEFVFRHTKHVMDRIEDAKMAMRGMRGAHEEYIEVARELCDLPITDNQRELFICEFVPMPPDAVISDRVVANVDTARQAIRDLFDGPTIPDAHRNTGYGLHLAGGEYLDHLRGFRTTETYFGRTMLRREPAKAKMTALIHEVATADV